MTFTDKFMSGEMSDILDFYYLGNSKYFIRVTRLLYIHKILFFGFVCKGLP